VIPYKIRDLAFRDKDLYDDRVYRNLIDSGLPIYERGISFEFSNLELGMLLNVGSLKIGFIEA
jgi:hypothetical protein